MDPVSLINSLMPQQNIAGVCPVTSASSAGRVLQGKLGRPPHWHQRTSLGGSSENKKAILAWEQIQILDDHPLEGDDVSMRDGGFGEGDELVPPQQETVATGPEITQTRDCGLWLTIHLQEYSLSDMYTIARDPVKSIDKVRDNNTDHG
ncbi:hypothetical protein IV203_006489 [Nitzschia inconspicua]|uniref:Uncharacterized protein n=1 Tax=Nitzschia inconspicua TaxID=303405 RepID=A0A9K3KAK0_9STRA|nr:hypothetical protein IV203_006644 [Nitzschia inconspicua]KAG7340085.1 hypothetical protein IV203_006489 [Nitzschia inconspicua]